MSAIPATSLPTGRARRRSPDLGRLLLPGYVVCFLFFIVLPIALVVIVSFSPSPFLRFPITDLSLRWYQRVFEYEPFITSLKTSVLLAVVSSSVGAVVAVPCALAIARSRSQAAKAVVFLLLSPISIPGIVVGFALLYYLAALGLGPGFTALLVAHTVIAIPYISRTVISVYLTMPASVEESAVILGASRAKVLLYVTLPQLRHGIFAGVLFAFLISLDNLPVSFFFGTAQTDTLPVVMMSYLQNQFDPSVAAIATIQMLLAVAALLVVDRVHGLGRMGRAV
ncbi:ABC transporter permease [Verticiella sediminum]|uniref:ABC transporter permease n=1 Tax=Verticiella sediminum TaxID=1247510 RepID=A0A556ACE9_9BURK|nr:ABC transporter permease [Verticiella sediminum]TSH90561.1 ABC transporter permease [Verticiella sediminum]